MNVFKPYLTSTKKIIFESTEPLDYRNKILTKLNTNVITILNVWKSNIQPLIDKYLREYETKLRFGNAGTVTPSDIKILCDIMCNKEYSFDGYTPNKILDAYATINIRSTVFINREHEANLKLLCSQHLEQLGERKRTFIVNEYSYAALKTWPTLTQLNKAHLLSNIILVLKDQHSQLSLSELLTVHLEELTQYEEYNKFITLRNMFDITDKQTIMSIFAGEYKTPSVELPDLFNN